MTAHNSKPHRSRSPARNALAAMSVIIGLAAGCATSAPAGPKAAGPGSAGEAASFSLKDATGQLQTLESIRGNGRLVVVFYRGQW
ncbi:MAG: cytochrome oxidase Cu insertion factor (SCO1/SenC/PrrC family) [Myxococcota bacterium]|jgi:cytochrome oxidase Cu insertion factor (SCO1/SenC/PrrC family)